MIITILKNIEILNNSLAAPGTYSPEKVNISNSPQYSFGVKTETHERNTVPGAFIIIICFTVFLVISLSNI